MPYYQCYSTLFLLSLPQEVSKPSPSLQRKRLTIIFFYLDLKVYLPRFRLPRSSLPILIPLQIETFIGEQGPIVPITLVFRFPFSGGGDDAPQS